GRLLPRLRRIRREDHFGRTAALLAGPQRAANAIRVRPGGARTGGARDGTSAGRVRTGSAADAGCAGNGPGWAWPDAGRGTRPERCIAIAANTRRLVMLDLVIAGGQVVTPQGADILDIGIQGKTIAALGRPGT